MKRLLLLFVAITMTTLMVSAQYADPFLTDEMRPDGIQWLPKPPSELSGEFYNDYFYYTWGKSMREKMGELALWDEAAELYQVYSESIGIELSPENTPEIIKLASGATSDASAAKKKVSNFYQRRRPFVTFGEPSLIPEKDEEVSQSYSFPSGHATYGWMYALVLCTVAPERTEAILEQARQFALSRVICGHHWKSDVDAGFILSTGVFTNVVVSEAYQQQLQKARSEYKRIKESTGIEAHKQSSQERTSLYHLDGSPATESSHGIVVRQGSKSLKP